MAKKDPESDPLADDSRDGQRLDTTTTLRERKQRKQPAAKYLDEDLELEKPRQLASSSNYFASSHRLGLTIALSVLLVVSAVFGLILPTPLHILEFLPPLYLDLIVVATATVLVMASYFLISFLLRSIRQERELRIRAEKSAREAQLLQDILAHDIRNYNQVSRMSAELIQEELADNKSVEPLVSTLLNSIDGSTQLVQRAKMLGKVFSDEDRERHPVNVVESIIRATDLVAGANPDRRINAVLKLDSAPITPVSSIDIRACSVEVLADGLLDEAFTNIISNSVKYTEEHEAFIAVEIKSRVYDDRLRKECCRISISDAGRGIPDGMKRSLFSRYLEGAKGSGLGLSIVHALVVVRYGGKIDVRDRVEGDHTKGTVIELWIPSAQQRAVGGASSNVPVKQTPVRAQDNKPEIFQSRFSLIKSISKSE